MDGLPNNKVGVIYESTFYQLLQFHFHWPAEHVIDGKRSDLEMHLVHKHSNSGKLLVIAVMHSKNKITEQGKIF